MSHPPPNKVNIKINLPQLPLHCCNIRYQLRKIFTYLQIELSMKLIFLNLRTRYLCEISYKISYQKDVGFFFHVKVTLQEILVLNESKRFLKVFEMLPRSDWSSIGLVPQIPWCTSPISHNAPCCSRNVRMCAHFCYKMVHCGIFIWCIVGFVCWVYKLRPE